MKILVLGLDDQIMINNLHQFLLTNTEETVIRYQVIINFYFITALLV